MRQRRADPKATDLAASASIKTSFLELIQELAKLTKDDNLVVAAVQNIFSQYRVTIARTMAPVKLVTTRPVRRRAGGRSSCWA
jgi:hypothetical protein